MAPTQVATKPIAFTMRIRFPCVFSWDDDYNDPESEKYQALVKKMTDWLTERYARMLEKYNLHLDLTFKIIGPYRRRRRSSDDFQPKIEARCKYWGEMDSNANLADRINDAGNDAISAIQEDSSPPEDIIDTTKEIEIEDFDLCSLEASSTICENGHVGAMIPKCALPADATPYLGSDVSCTGSEYGDYVVFVNSDQCPIPSTKLDQTLVYSGSINWVDGEADPNSVIVRSRSVKVDFSCVFETSFMLSTANGVTPLIAKKEIDLGVEEGKVDLNLGLWESSAFVTPLASDAVIEVPDKLYVGVVLEGAFNSVMENCWATPRSVILTC